MIKYLSFFFLILLFSFSYKLFATNFWSVELYQFWYSDPNFNFLELWNERWVYDYHLPTFHIITWAWFNIFEYTQLSAHIFQIFLYSLPFVYITFLLKKIQEKKKLIYFIILWSLLPAIIFHALEFRVYFFVSFLSLLYFLNISHLIEINSKNLLSISNLLLASLISLLHYWGCILVFSIGIYLFLFRYRQFSFKKIFVLNLIPLIFVLIFLIPKIEQIFCCYVDDPTEYQKVYTFIPALKVFVYSVTWKSKIFFYIILLILIINILYLFRSKQIYKIINDNVFKFTFISLIIGFITAYFIEFYLHIWKPYTALIFSPLAFYLIFAFINNKFFLINSFIIVSSSIFLGPLFTSYNKYDWYKPAKQILDFDNCDDAYIFSSISSDFRGNSVEFFNNFYFNKDNTILEFYDNSSFKKNISLIKKSKCKAILYGPHTSEEKIKEIFIKISKEFENPKLIEIEKNSSYIITK